PSPQLIDTVKSAAVANGLVSANVPTGIAFSGWPSTADTGIPVAEVSGASATTAVAVPLIDDPMTTVLIVYEPSWRYVWLPVTTNGVPTPPGWVIVPSPVVPSPHSIVAVKSLILPNGLVSTNENTGTLVRAAPSVAATGMPTGVLSGASA